MSSGLPKDWNETKEQMRNPKAPTKGRNWLRHGENTHCAAIDEMIMSGTYSTKEMAQQLNDRFGDRPLQKWIDRIKWHLDHLQDRPIGEMKPHQLKLKEINGKWKFDV